MCIAFWSQCRLAELCIDGVFDPQKHPSRNSLRRCGITVTGIKYGSFWAPSTKTSPNGQEILWTDSACPASAVWAIKNHLEINDKLPANAHLFAFEADDGKHYVMRRSWFLDRCNEIWKSAGLPTITGHSFRIGGTTHLLLISVDPFVLMVQGWWKSNAFLEYWRNCEEIIPTLIGFSLQSHSSILTQMNAFKQCLIAHS